MNTVQMKLNNVEDLNKIYEMVVSVRESMGIMLPESVEEYFENNMICFMPWLDGKEHLMVVQPEYYEEVKVLCNIVQDLLFLSNKTDNWTEKTKELNLVDCVEYPAKTLHVTPITAISILAQTKNVNHHNIFLDSLDIMDKWLTVA